MRQASIELRRYKSTRNFTYASQASEKCWVVCTLIIEQRLRIELRTGSIRKIIPYATELGMEDITRRCFALHQYHYEGSLAFTEEDLDYEIGDAIRILQSYTEKH